MLGRLTQPLEPRAVAFMIQIFTDDPRLVLLGSEGERQMTRSVIVVTWLRLGLRVALHKAKRGKTLVWTGVQYTLVGQGLEITINPELLKEVLEMTVDFMATNLIGAKALREYTGKANFIATIIPIWRPFLNALWAALSKHDQMKLLGARGRPKAPKRGSGRSRFASRSSSFVRS